MAKKPPEYWKKDKDFNRKYYRFQEHAPMGAYLIKERPMAFLKRLAKRVWDRHGGRKEMPDVLAGAGVVLAEGLTSFYDVDWNRIILERHQRTVLVLLHELAHALVYRRAKYDHGPAFMKMYAKLVADFGKEEHGYILLHLIATGYKVDV